MSISSSPTRTTGASATAAWYVRRTMASARASSSSGEKGTVRMSSTPRSKAASFVLRSPRRVSAIIGTRIIPLPPSPASPASPVWACWSASPTQPSRSITRSGPKASTSMSRATRCHSPCSSAAAAASTESTARMAKLPWFSVRPIKSASTGWSVTTSTRTGSPRLPDPPRPPRDPVSPVGACGLFMGAQRPRAHCDCTPRWRVRSRRP